MLQLLRTNSTNPEFRELVSLLDADLAERDGEDHAFYHQYNGLEGLDRAVVCFQDGQAVGCGALKEFDRESVEIKRMFTNPEYRGKGIAAGVLKELELWAADDGFSRMVLETGLRNPEAIGLYEKYGYRRIPNFEPYVGVENSVCFEKKL